MVGLKECPYTLADEMWTDSVTKWSSIEFPLIYQILSPDEYTREKLKAYKSFAIDAYNYLLV